MSATMLSMVNRSSTGKRLRSDLHGYQNKALEFSLHHSQCALWLDMGLGKTAVALTNILQRQHMLQVYGTLVIAPLRVIQTVWRQEASKWEHTKGLRFSLIHGTPDVRRRAFAVPADVYLVNYEGIDWLSKQLVHHYLSRGKYLPFNMVVFDEVSRLKDHTTKRHKALRDLLPFIPYRMGLTGTPAANGYMDLFGQYLALDSGTRLGTSRTAFAERFFHQNGWGVGSRWEVNTGAEKRIEELIGDVTMQMSAQDYLELPPVVFNDIWVDLPTKARAQYEKLERDMFLELDSGQSIEVFNAAALTTKCLQAANGALYTSVGGPWEETHKAKLEALEEVIEEQAGKPLLLAYSFRHDAARIEKSFKGVEHISSKLGTLKTNELLTRWDRGRVPILQGHPASMGHGLNLQAGSDTLVWFGLPWSLELYQQTIDRLAGGLRRQRPITVHRILARDTTDEAVKMALEAKATTQEGLKTALNEYRKNKQGRPSNGPRTD